MRKTLLKRLLCTALTVSLIIPVFSAATVSGVTIEPRFGRSGHIDRQCKYVAENLDLTAEQQTILEDAAWAADNLYSKVRGFHARKNKDGSSNYLANLKALEICGVKIDKVSDLETYVSSRLPNISAQDKTEVAQVVSTVINYCKGKNYTREQKRYAIAGFGLHLIGDMFAHRAIIKKVCLTYWDEPNTATSEHFHTKDFIAATVEDFKAGIRQGKFCTVDMKPYLKDDVNPGKQYIDNIKFMPSRIKAAERAAASFVETVFVKGIAFPDINYFLEEYNLQLEKFAQYKAAL